jgi:hypothetical protein
LVSGTFIGGIGMAQHETARKIASQVIKTFGDPRHNLGSKLSWSMSTAANLLENYPHSLIKKTKFVNPLF